MGKTPDHFAQAWANREWGIEGINEEATARRWFDKGMREGMRKAAHLIDDEAFDESGLCINPDLSDLADRIRALAEKEGG